MHELYILYGCETCNKLFEDYWHICGIFCLVNYTVLNGDLKENAEYHAAREKQSFIEGRVIDLEDKIARAEVIDVSKLSGDTVKFGAHVKLVDDDDKEVTYRIVGDYEADIAKNRISFASPIARAIMGKEVGDYVEVNTPRGGKGYEILEVRF